MITFLLTRCKIWIKLLVFVVTTTTLCQNLAWPNPYFKNRLTISKKQVNQEKLAPESIFSTEDSVIQKEDIGRYYRRIVDIFSIADSPQERLSLVRELLQKTIFRGEEKRISRKVLLSLITIFFSISGLVCLITNQTVLTIAVAVISFLILSITSYQLFKPHFVKGALTLEDFKRFRLRKIFALILSEPKIGLADGYTELRKLPDGREELLSIKIFDDKEQRANFISHEAIHALRGLGKLRISCPEHEYILANSITVLLEEGFFHTKFLLPIVEEKLKTVRRGKRLIVKSTGDECLALINAVAEIIKIGRLKSSEDSHSTFQQAEEELERFSSIFAEHNRILKERGLSHETEHLLPVHLRALQWAYVAQSFIEDYGRLAALIMLKNFASSPPTRNDGDVRQLITGSLEEARAIISGYEEKSHGLSPETKQHIMGLVKEGFLSDADELLSVTLRVYHGDHSIGVSEVASTELLSIKDEGRITQGTEAMKEFNVKRATGKYKPLRDMYPTFWEGLQGVATKTGISFDGVTVYSIQSIIKAKDDFVHGYFDRETKELFLSINIMQQAKAYDDNYTTKLLDEYIEHELKCSGENHQELRIQQRQKYHRHGNYKDTTTDEGRLRDIIREDTDMRNAANQHIEIVKSIRNTTQGQKVVLAFDTDIGNMADNPELLKQISEVSGLFGEIDFIADSGSTSLEQGVNTKVSELQQRGVTPENIKVIVVTNKKDKFKNHAVTLVEDSAVVNYIPLLEILSFALTLHLEPASTDRLKDLYHAITGQGLREADIERIRKGELALILPPIEKISPEIYKGAIEVLTAA